MAVLYHVVEFKFTEKTSVEKRNEIRDALLELKDLCVSESTKKPYILSAVGGENNSPEGLSVS